MSSVKKFLIIDANSVLHRAFYALPALTTKKGELVNAIYGFCLVFLKSLEEIKPDFVAAAFDLPAPTFRHKEYKEYKAKRPPAPVELYQQIKGIKEILNAFKVPIFEKEGFEADDLIGSIVQSIKEKQIWPKIEIIISSGDLDLLQLVDEQSKVYFLKKGVKEIFFYEKEGVKQRYQGLNPSQLVDFKALRGDPSDNIPGVTGIGEKTAIHLIKEFGDLENLYQEMEKKTEKFQRLKEGVRKKLKDYKEQAFISKFLAQIRCDAPLNFKLFDCQFKNIDKEKIIEVFKSFDFTTLVKRFEKSKFCDKIIFNKFSSFRKSDFFNGF